MIIRSLSTVKSVDWGNGLSRRFLLEADGFGYTMTDTTVRAGTSSQIAYARHQETCYCIAGRGAVVETSGETHVIEPGTQYALDKGEAHTLVASPDEDLRLVCVFVPALSGDEHHSLDSEEFSEY